MTSGTLLVPYALVQEAVRLFVPSTSGIETDATAPAAAKALELLLAFVTPQTV